MSPHTSNAVVDSLKTMDDSCTDSHNGVRVCGNVDKDIYSDIESSQTASKSYVKQ